MSQSQFARILGDRVDAGTVSRWERGALVPQPWNRKRLAEIARRNKHYDLAALLRDHGFAEFWRLGLRSTTPELSNLLTRLEICVINAEIMRATDVVADCTFKSLADTVESFVSHLAAKLAEEAGEPAAEQGQAPELERKAPEAETEKSETPKQKALREESEALGEEAKAVQGERNTPFLFDALQYATWLEIIRSREPKEAPPGARQSPAFRARSEKTNQR